MVFAYGAQNDDSQFILLNSADKAFVVDLTNATASTTLHMEDITRILPVFRRTLILVAVAVSVAYIHGKRRRMRRDGARNLVSGGRGLGRLD
ncbi:MAG: hypothetical protein BYD32DRAFT_462442 [Podila humilis]|nr:MAG: hypothetical protein BYD32DRAFT_462442 [Podila humilis]